MTLFIIIFALAVGYSFIWTQNASIVGAAVTAEIEFEHQRAAEVLYVTAINNSAILVTNPTNLWVNITQIWNSTHYLTNTAVSVRSSNYTVITGLASNDSYFKLITQRGNVFFSSPQKITTYPSASWKVNYWAKNSSTYNFGNTAFYDMSFTVNLDKNSWKVTNILYFGFNATTIIRPIAGANNITAIVSLSPLNQGPPGTNLINMTLSNGLDVKNHIFTNSSSYQFPSIDPTKTYLTQIFTNSSESQVISITIVGADFG
jgi:hypothetical protein